MNTAPILPESRKPTAAEVTCSMKPTQSYSTEQTELSASAEPVREKQKSGVFAKATWTVLLIVGLAFAGFLHGVTHERSRWTQALGACDLPAGSHNVVLILRADNGSYYCQARMR